jgi:cyclophilin family peptidyl-prolyl cis-trans isomerase
MKRLFRLDILFYTLCLTLIISSCHLRPGVDLSELEGDIFAVFNTSKGEFVAELFYKDVPMTVTNFVGLAEGTKDSNKPEGTHFYDGTKFHHIIEGLLIQGGSPDGTGLGNPGYHFPNEINPDLKHDAPGTLSMANSGPNTNGSQFYITLKATPRFDNYYTVFGKVVSGQDVVNSLKKGDTLKSVQILRKGVAAEEFKADQAAFDRRLETVKKKIAAQKKEEAREFATSVKEKWPKAKKTSSGLWYVITKEGHGAKPKKGQKITVHYETKLLDGTVVFSSFINQTPYTFDVGMKKVIPAWDESFLDMKLGEKRTVISPYSLAYGEKGMTRRIPPNTNLILDLELIRIQ